MAFILVPFILFSMSIFVLADELTSLEGDLAALDANLSDLSAYRESIRKGSHTTDPENGIDFGLELAQLDEQISFMQYQRSVLQSKIRELKSEKSNENNSQEEDVPPGMIPWKCEFDHALLSLTLQD